MAEPIRTFFREQYIRILSILRALSKTIPKILLAESNVFGGEEGSAASGSSPLKDEEALKKWLNKLASVFKRLTGKAVKALSAIVESVIRGVLTFPDKAVLFVAEHTWVWDFFVAAIVGEWLMRKPKT